MLVKIFSPSGQTKIKQISIKYQTKIKQIANKNQANIKQKSNIKYQTNIYIKQKSDPRGVGKYKTYTNITNLPVFNKANDQDKTVLVSLDIDPKWE